MPPFYGVIANILDIINYFVPMLCVGMHIGALCVPTSAQSVAARGTSIDSSKLFCKHHLGVACFRGKKKEEKMAEKIVTKEILDGKRNLHIFHTDLSADEISMMGNVFVRAVTTCNNVLAKGLTYASAADMLSKKKSLMMYTKWQDFGKWVHIRQGSDKGKRRWDHACEFIWKEYSDNWRLDRNKTTKESFVRVFGDKAAVTHEKLCLRDPFQKLDVLGRDLGDQDMATIAKTTKGSLLAVIAGLNLKDVYVNVKSMGGTIGSAGMSHGSWRYMGDPMPLTRTEEHLYKWAPNRPINLNKSYLSANVPNSYKGLYGTNRSKADIITLTLIHEAAHVFIAAADYFYFEPHNKKLRAEAAADHSSSAGTPIPNPKTTQCAVNADSLAWFIYFWGGGQST